MRQVVVLIFFLTFIPKVFGQELPTWYTGSIVLATNEVLVGEISVQLNHDLILLKKVESIVVYPAHRISAAYLYDVAANINRKYLSLRDDHRVFKVHHLYEIVLYGNVSVVRKQKSSTLQRKEPSDKFDFDYFTSVDNHLTSLMHFRSEIYPKMIEVSNEQILSFTQENRLNPNLPADAIRIIEFYNKTVKSHFFSSDLKQFQAAK